MVIVTKVNSLTFWKHPWAFCIFCRTLKSILTFYWAMYGWYKTHDLGIESGHL